MTEPAAGHRRAWIWIVLILLALGGGAAYLARALNWLLFLGGLLVACTVWAVVTRARAGT